MPEHGLALVARDLDAYQSRAELNLFPRQ